MSGAQTTANPPDGGSELPAPAVDPAVEARARRMGWRPREEYTGDPARWQGAADFVERAETMLPLAVANNHRLERQVDQLTKQIGEYGTTMAEMVQRTRNAEAVGYRRARAEIEAERSAAVAAGDTEGFNAAERKLKDLGPEPEVQPTRAAPATPTAPAAPPAGQPQPDPVVSAWIGQNPWFNTNLEAKAVAIGIHGAVTQEMPGTPLIEQLAETTRRMRRRFPELFSAEPAAHAPAGDGSPPPRRQAAQAVAAPQSLGAPGRGANPRSFDAMPADVKRQYDRQVKLLEGKGEAFTKEEFARYYWEQFEEAE